MDLSSMDKTKLQHQHYNYNRGNKDSSSVDWPKTATSTIPLNLVQQGLVAAGGRDKTRTSRWQLKPGQQGLVFGGRDKTATSTILLQAGQQVQLTVKTCNTAILLQVRQQGLVSLSGRDKIATLTILLSILMQIERSGVKVGETKLQHQQFYYRRDNKDSLFSGRDKIATSTILLQILMQIGRSGV